MGCRSTRRGANPRTPTWASPCRASRISSACTGPGTNAVNGASIIYNSECQMRYIMGCIDMVLAGGCGRPAPRADVCDDYNRRNQDRLKTMVYTHPKVVSYYKNAAGTRSHALRISDCRLLEVDSPPQPRRLRSAALEDAQLAQGVAIRVHIGGEQFGLFEGGEMPTALLHRIMHQVVTLLGPDPRGSQSSYRVDGIARRDVDPARPMRSAAPSRHGRPRSRAAPPMSRCR